MPAPPATLDPFFHPRSIAVIGASANPVKIGGRTYRFLRDNGFAGPVYPINPTHKQVQGNPTYSTLEEVPGEVDLAFVIVPAPLAPQALEACAEKGVRGVVIFSSGFAEVDAQGRALQQRMEEIARAGSLRVMGPNCMGVVNLRAGLLGTFSGSIDYYRPQAGSVGIISQSGAFGVYCLALAHRQKLGVSLWATTGNSMDVDVAECLAYMAEDADTKVIMAYLEGVTAGEPLARALALAQQRQKPVVMLKVGRSEVGAQAAASHTASLAGADAVYNALFQQYGVHRARTLDELMDITKACTYGVFPQGNTVGLVTISGGVGVIMADDAEDLGLRIPPTPQALQKQLKALLPYAAVGNPVDITAQALNDMNLVEKNLELMLAQGGYDAIVLFLATVGMNQELMRALQEPLIALRKRYPRQPLLLSCVWEEDSLVAPYEEAGFMLHQDPTRTMECLAALVRLGERFRAARPAAPPPLPATAAAPPREAAGEHAARRILRAAGLPVLEERLVQTAAEAAQAQRDFGSALALKIASAELPHKTEVGGVLLDVASADAAAQGFEALLARVRAAAPQARLDGVLASPMIRGGVETIVGVKRDPVFGPVVLFGLGGVFVEVFRDTALRLAPFGEAEALEMIRSIRGAPLLFGARGRPKMNVAALARALSLLSVYAHTYRDGFESMELNPFVVLPQDAPVAGQGALALDAFIAPRLPS